MDYIYIYMYTEEHEGIDCDECYVMPIVGPRFRSLVRIGYDICRNCYIEEINKGSDELFEKVSMGLTEQVDQDQYASVPRSFAVGSVI